MFFYFYPLNNMKKLVYLFALTTVFVSCKEDKKEITIGISGDIIIPNVKDDRHFGSLISKKNKIILKASVF